MTPSGFSFRSVALLPSLAEATSPLSVLTHAKGGEQGGQPCERPVWGV